MGAQLSPLRRNVTLNPTGNPVGGKSTAKGGDGWRELGSLYWAGQVIILWEDVRQLSVYAHGPGKRHCSEEKEK